MAWGLVQTRPNQERRAQRSLRRFGFKTYLPLFKDRNRVRRILFQQYIFVQIVPSAPDWHRIFRMEGVTRLFLVDEQPAKLPKTFVKELQAQENRNGLIDLTGGDKTVKLTAYTQGELLKVVRGQFQDFVATYDHRTKGGHVGYVELFGRQVRVEFEANQFTAG